MHILEHHTEARLFFDNARATKCKSAQSAFRFAVRALTGGLPAWAQPSKPGPKPRALPHAEASPE